MQLHVWASYSGGAEARLICVSNGDCFNMNQQLKIQLLLECFTLSRELFTIGYPEELLYKYKKFSIIGLIWI